MSATNRSADTKPETYRYDDMVDLPHHVSASRPHMSNHDRAAQFSPFAALTGYEAAVKEAARRTRTRIELDESSKSILAEKLRIVQTQAALHPAVTITYFLPDPKKAGGAYTECAGTVSKIDESAHLILMTDGVKIPINEVIAIQGDLFRSMESEFE